MASKKELKKKQKINILKVAADGLTKLGGGMAKETSKAASGVAKGISNVAKAAGGAASEAAAGPVTGIMRNMASSNTKSTPKDVRTQKISSLKSAAEDVQRGGNRLRQINRDNTNPVASGADAMQEMVHVASFGQRNIDAATKKKKNKK